MVSLFGVLRSFGRFWAPDPPPEGGPGQNIQFLSIFGLFWTFLNFFGDFYVFECFFSFFNMECQKLNFFNTIFQKIWFSKIKCYMNNNFDYTFYYFNTQC